MIDTKFSGTFDFQRHIEKLFEEHSYIKDEEDRVEMVRSKLNVNLKSEDLFTDLDYYVFEKHYLGCAPVQIVHVVGNVNGEVYFISKDLLLLKIDLLADELVLRDECYCEDLANHYHILSLIRKYKEYK